MSINRLNQVIAIEKTTKAKLNAEVDALYKAAQKPALFDGARRTYQPRSEDGEVVPPQVQKVQFKAAHVVRDVAAGLSQLIDLAARKDFANTEARADIKLDGKVLATGVPTTHLLYLEKILTDFQTVVEKLPTLDPAENWTFDPALEMYRSDPTQTTRTKKVQQALVLYPATEKHPAQTQLVTEDVVVGTFDVTKFSGAMDPATKRAHLDRIRAVLAAVKAARQEANEAPAPEVKLAESLMKAILG